MKLNEHLLKQSASVLRKIALEKEYDSKSLKEAMLSVLSRKELIEMVSQKHNGQIPKSLDLASLENEELLSHIGNDLELISFVTGKMAPSLDTINVSEPKKSKEEKISSVGEKGKPGSQAKT